MSSNFISQSNQEILCSRLNDLVEYVLDKFPFYKAAFSHISKLKIESLNDVLAFPLLDKKHPNILTLLNQVLSSNPPVYFETSGTSGNPFPVISDFSAQRNKEFSEFLIQLLSLKTDKVNKAIVALPFEMNPVGLKYFFALSQLGITVIPVGVKTHLCPPQKLIEVVDRLQPELLIARPLETLRYAEAMIAKGIDPKKSSIKKIIMTGEIVSKSKFERISRVYGNAEVYSVYGLTEVDSGGLISCRHYQYHLPESPYLLVELLKDDFKTPVLSDGEIGNIVLTNTQKNYLPLFRYNTGDKGRLKLHCDCGQFHTPVINLMGRESDCIISQENVVFPIEIEEILFRYDQIAADYQIISKNSKVELRVELLQSCDQSQIDVIIKNLKADIHTATGLLISDVHVFMPGKLAGKLGIAKSKAGRLYILDGLTDADSEEYLKINYDCIN